MDLKFMEKIYLGCPLSLGDYFVCNSLVLTWCQQATQVHIPVVPQFIPTVAALYQDHANVIITPFLGNQIEDQYIQENQLHPINLREILQYVKIPLHGSSEIIQVPVNKGRQIYEYFDIPYSSRYLNFQLPQNIPNSLPLMHKLNPHNEPYVLFHKHTNKHVGGLPIDLSSWRPAANLPDKKIIEVELGHTANLLDYWELIQHADEIHCVPSSFYHLVDSVANKISAMLFYHNYRNDIVNQINTRWNGSKWHNVEYIVKI